MRTFINHPMHRPCVATIAMMMLSTALPSHAATFTVTRTDDPAPGTCDVGDCSLREAIMAANAAGGADTITLPAGTYTLTIPSGASDTDASVGDLDIAAGGLTINGGGAATTTISAAGLGHRVFHLPVDILIPNATVTINDVTITGGNATGLGASFNRGGGIEASSRFLTLNLNNVVVTGNNAGSGGGIFSQCTLNITNSTISSNTGAGIMHAADGSNFRTATLTGSTVSGNSASGVDVNAGTFNISNSTISGNGAGGGFTGGVDYGGGTTFGTLTNVTIAGNRYGYIGQNDFAGDPAVTIRNTIIANSTVRNIFNNPADADFARPPASGGNNLISDTSGTSFTQATDKNNVNPLLVALAVNAPGTTATHALSVGSPALDSASAAFAPATDQRGVVRPQGAADDIGAFELIPPDDDMDGFSPPADCDDNDEDVHPGATEIPNDGIDQDCNGADTITCFVDGDGDGFGSTGTLLADDGDCTDLGESTNDLDCNDANASINPGAAEACNGVDDDCDDDVDEGAGSTFYQDADTDGFGDAAVTTQACEAPPGYVSDNTDCDDSNASIHPGAAEIPDDTVDQDCNGSDAITCFVDADTDGFGDTTTLISDDEDCTDSGESANDADCDDTDSSVHPGAAETPDDTIDQDCSGSDSVTCFVDADGDGFGSVATVVDEDGDCLDLGQSAIDTDCNDGDSAVNPGAAEVCDGVDNNCNGAIDEGFPDLDVDGTPDCIDDDRDGDGTPNAADGCPDDPNKTAPGTAGCGNPEPSAPIDQDGVSDAVENGAPNNGDGNNDGIPDSQQVNVTSLPNADGTYVTIVSPAGTQLGAVSAGGNPSPTDTPAGVQFPAGFLTYQINGLAAGAAVQVQVIVHLPPGTAMNTYWKFGPEPGQPTPHWYEFLFDGTTGATISGNTITLHFVDGQRGDADLAANGSIQDPGAPAIAQDSAAPQTPPSDLCVNPLLSFLFRLPVCGIGCSMAIIGSFGGLMVFKTARRRRR